MTLNFQKLKLITAALLSQLLDYNAIRNATISLKELFENTVGFDDTDPDNQPHILTGSGQAVGPWTAAFCVTDMMRTRKFILGIRDAIQERLKIEPGKPVTVLYAGTGPFATLLTPLTTVFSPLQLKLILLEINPVSFGFLQKTIQKFEMKDYLVEAVLTDAVTWNIPANLQPDIIVSETMMPGLNKEPQVSIVANLLSQSNRNPILIPESIKVDACLLGNMNSDPDPILYLETLIELNAVTAIQIKKDPENVEILSTGMLVTIPEMPGSKYSTLVLNTTIQVFSEHVLGFNESAITIPFHLMKTTSFKKYPVKLLFQYNMGNKPGFSVTEI
jgi:predicted RNA methylase